MNWKKLSVFAPMLSVAVVGGCIWLTLGNYTPPVYEVEAQESIVEPVQEEQEEDAVEEEEEEEPAAGEFDLEDGVYRGVGNGFAGTITVSVEIKDKKITAINILDVEADDDAFFNRAKGVIDKIISSQSLDVDVVSGATYSSRGIISAVKNALTGEKDSSESPGTSAAASPSGSTSVGYVQESGSYRDGTYYGTGTGFGGQMTVQVDISGGKIVSIQITQHNDGSSYIQKASGLISNIIASQSTNVDTVSGATYSSVGIIQAVRNALSQAAADGTENAPQNTTLVPTPTIQPTQAIGSGKVDPVTEADAYRDGTYYGTGTGFGGTMKVKVTVSGGKIASASIEEHKDGSEYIQMASSILQTIVSAQSTNVDTVSGATYSSAGIIEAVRDALKQAEVQSGGDSTNNNGNNNDNNNNNENNDPDNAAAPSGTVPYLEGIYYGSGEGFMGRLTVAVVIQEETIKAILVTENEADDEAFLDRAKAVIANVVKQQNTDVDVVSGATYSSQGLLEAVTNALEEAKKATEAAQNPDTPDDDEQDPENPDGDDQDSENPGDDQDAENPDGDEQDPENPGGDDQDSENPGDEQEPENPDGDEQPEEGSVYFNGEYTAQVFCEPDAFGDFDTYILSLKMKIENDQIVSITDIQGDGSPTNDTYINWAANGRGSAAGVVTQILEKNSIEGVDTVSRATCSSNAIIEACRLILESARQQ